MIQCHARADQNGHVVRFVHQLLLARGLLLLYLGPSASSVLRQARVVAVYYVMLCYVTGKKL